MSVESAKMNALAKTPSRPGSTAQMPGLGVLLKALGRRWLFATSLALLVAAAAVAAVWFGLPPPKHEANSMLHIAANRPSILSPGSQGAGEFSIYQQSQKAHLLRRDTLITALRQSKIADLTTIRELEDDPIVWLQRELKVDFKSGAEFMRVSLRGDRPEEIRLIVAAVISAYLTEVVNKERYRQEKRLEQLQEILGKYEEILKVKRRQVRELALVAGSRDPQALAAKQRYAFEAMGQIQKELLQHQTDSRRLRLEVKSLEEKVAGQGTVDVPTEMVEAEFRKDPHIAEQLKKKDAAEKELARFLP